MSDIDPNKAIDFLLNNAGRFSKAKADRIYLEEFRKSKKALLMNQCQEKTVNAREQYAYSHPEYLQLLDGLRAAVEVEEDLKWHLISAQLRVDVYRTQEASNRGMDRAAR